MTDEKGQLAAQVQERFDKLVLARAWVLHRPTLIVGRVVKLLEPGAHIGFDERPVEAWVVELEERHRFLAEDAFAFQELTEAEAALYHAVIEGVGTVIAGAIGTLGASGQLDPSRASVGVELVEAAITAQLRAFGKPPPDAG